ncbi:hypothetical protein GYMLUDRAFT_63253 [Collybiopsis luxurians FD-317 M1]|uniref:Uncharacterized protein n=1 Tax=Collybiopsis luxurians FD-317 M1 TaxID=944289 RepID=A0A0D0CH90_9AGAR|nr:hypothetical protein GYMLUDRAFT_63253 [Collybiopsis luxurians FD-317 M1]
MTLQSGQTIFLPRCCDDLLLRYVNDKQQCQLSAGYQKKAFNIERFFGEFFRPHEFVAFRKLQFLATTNFNLAKVSNNFVISGAIAMNFVSRSPSGSTLSIFSYMGLTDKIVSWLFSVGYQSFRSITSKELLCEEISILARGIAQGETPTLQDRTWEFYCQGINSVDEEYLVTVSACIDSPVADILRLQPSTREMNIITAYNAYSLFPLAAIGTGTSYAVRPHSPPHSQQAIRQYLTVKPHLLLGAKESLSIDGPYTILNYHTFRDSFSRIIPLQGNRDASFDAVALTSFSISYAAKSLMFNFITCRATAGKLTYCLSPSLSADID